MTGYHFDLRCPVCAGRLSHVNGTALGSESSAVARCGACGEEWVVTVYVTALETPERVRARQRKRASRMRVVT